MQARSWAAAVVVALGALAAAPVAQAAIFAQEPGSPYPQTGSPAANDTYGIATGDFNGDGRPDLVAVNGSSETATVHLRTAANGFTQEGPPITLSGGPGYAKTADFNGDGKTDIVVTTNSGAIYTLLRKVSNDGFTVEGPKPTFSPIADVAVGNFNGDARPDLAVSHYSAGDVMVLMRQSTGAGWDIEGTTSTGGLSTDPRGLVAFDFNSDGGTDDIAVANRGTDNVLVLKRNGNPGTGFTVTPGEGFSAQDEPVSVVARDFNGDGRTDLAAAAYVGDQVSLAYRRTSGATWDLTETGGGGSNHLVGDAPIGLAAGDFNLDGKLDLAASVSGEDTVAVLLRKADNTGWVLDDPAPVTPGDTPNSLVTADFNADGRPDLATANQASDNFSVLRNNGIPPPPPPPPPHRRLLRRPGPRPSTPCSASPPMRPPTASASPGSSCWARSSRRKTRATGRSGCAAPTAP